MSKVVEKGLIAKKVGMSRIVDDQGVMVPVTLLKIEKQSVTKLLTMEKDRYQAYQVGYFSKAKKNLSKADLGRLSSAQVEESFARFKEFRVEEPLDPSLLGKSLGVDWLKDVEALDVTGITKGRGFQGAVKRWNATIGRMSHGSRFHRRPGSLGQRSTPGRVFKNKKQRGHMGAVSRTISNLRILHVHQDVIAVKGSVPGARNGYLAIRPTNRIVRK